MKRHAVESEAGSGGAKEREIKDLIRAYEVKLRASQGTDFVNLQVELNRNITEVRNKNRPEDVKKRHQQELQDHIKLYSQLTETCSASSSASRSSSLAPKEPPSSQSDKGLAKRPLAKVRDWTTSLELDGSRVRWMVHTTLKFSEPKRQRLNNASHTSHGTKTPAPIKTLRYDQVRRNSIRDCHWDTIVEWPTSSGQFWVLFCAQHDMHFKKNALIAAAKHVKGPLHGAPNKEFLTALIEIGYYIPDCNEERARFHNAEVQLKLDNGYRPCNRFDTKTKAERLVVSNITAPKPPQTQPSRRTKCRLITNPKPFHAYYCYFEKQYWACLILGWDKQSDACPFKTLEETELFREKARPPGCYTRSKKKITGWAEGFEDGGPKEDLREFPIMYFDGGNHVGWAPAFELSKIDLTSAPKSNEYPESSYNEAREWIASAAGYSTWEEYRASGVNIKQLMPASTSDGQTPALEPTNSPSGHSVSDFDEVLEVMRARGGDDTDDKEYQDNGRGFTGGRPSDYVIEYEHDEWTAKYNTRQAGVSAAKSLATQACKPAGKNQQLGLGHKSNPVTRPSTGTGSDPGKTQWQRVHSPTCPPTNIPPDDRHDRLSEARPNPGIGAPSSENVPSVTPVATTTAKSTGAGLGPGFSKPGCRLPELQALVTDSLSQDRARDFKLQLPEASREAKMKTAASDDRPFASPITSIADQRTVSANPMSADLKQRRASVSSMATTMSGEVMTAILNQSLVTSPISAASTPMMAAASRKTSTYGRLRPSGKARVFEITKYADATQAWERADREEACIKLCLSEDEKRVATSDERISIAIDPQQCINPQLKTIEGREGMSLMTVPQVSGEVISMVFDRSRGSKIELGKIQARNFVRWLQAQNARLQ